MTEIKHVKGMGFDTTIMDTEEHPDFPCEFHKLGEDFTPLPCPEEPFIFISLARIEEGLSMCRKHYARFVLDLVDTLEAFIVTEEVSDLDLPSEEEDGILAIKENSAITKSGFYEAIMLAKRELQGVN